MTYIKYLIINQQIESVALGVSFASGRIRFRLPWPEHRMENFCILIHASVLSLYIVVYRPLKILSSIPQSVKRS